MAEISGLSVKVSAAVAGFNAGMGRAQDAAGDLALSLRRLDLASDSTERGLDSAGRSASTTAFQFTGLSFASSILSTRIFGLSAALWGVLIPALAALSTALAPLVAGLLGFVAIAGAIGGIGLIGTIGAIATNTEELKESFTGMVDTLTTELAPAFDLAAEVLIFFMEEVEDVADQLLPSEQAMSRLAANFANLGEAVIEMLPAFSRLATELALRFLPPFVQFADRILPRVPGMITSLANAFDDILPILLGFGRWFGRIAPDLHDFGMVVLQSVANGLGVVGDAIGEVLSIGASSDSLTEFLKRMVTSAGAWIKNKGLPMISGIASDILDQLETYFESGGSEDLAGVVSSFMGSLATSLGQVKDKDINKVANQLSVVLGGVMQTLRTTLQSGEAGALGTEIARLSGTVIGVLFDTMVAYANSDQFAEDVAVLSTAIASGLAKGITIATKQALSEISLKDVAEAAADPTMGVSGVIAEEISRTSQQAQEQQTPAELRGQARDILVQVTGDTGVVREVTAEEINNQQRTTRRRQGRITQG